LIFGENVLGSDEVVTLGAAHDSLFTFGADKDSTTFFFLANCLLYQIMLKFVVRVLFRAARNTRSFVFFWEYVTRAKFGSNQSIPLDTRLQNLKMLP
jgi:hypothetical protein